MAFTRAVWFPASLLLAFFATKAVAQEQTQQNASIAHGVLMAISFGFLMPFGATIMHLFRFKGFVWFHAGWQIFAYLLVLAGFGLGVWIAVSNGQLTASNGHPIIGIIVTGMLFLQPLGGWLAHHSYQQKGRKTVVHATHRWVGRVFLTLGAINAGLGLQLSGNTTKGEIAYGVIAGFFFLLWAAVWAWDLSRSRAKPEPEKGGLSHESSTGS